MRSTTWTAAITDVIRILLIGLICLGALPHPAAAQAPSQQSQQNDWAWSVYPVLAWVPVDIDIDINIPPFNGDAGGAGQILDSQLDGAFFGGVTASNGTWRVEGYGIWASFGGDRPSRPFMVVDMDLVYGDARLGRRIAPDLFATAGVRRVALNYDITLGDLPPLSRKPGVWDPVIGIGWHRVRPRTEWHASFEGGGFGAGADVDLAAMVRADWKPVRHFGLTAGYNFLYLKITDTVAGRTVVMKPRLHGPTVGIGLYF